MFNQKNHLRKISNSLDECKCLICNKILKKYSALGSRLKIHNINSKDYYDKYILNYDTNCSCGKDRKFYSIKHGYFPTCGKYCELRNKGENNAMFGIHYKSPTHSERMKGNKYGVGNISNKGKKFKLSAEERKRRINHIKNVNAKGFENKGGRCQFYNYNGLILQGRYELYYAMNSKIALKKCKQIKTSFGFYTPDFETNKYFIEIKSTYTFRTCVKGKQYQKIKWVRKNLKPVKIIILDELKVHYYLKEYNLNTIKFKHGRIKET